MTDQKIEQIIDKTAKATVLELKKEKLLRSNKTPFQKTETLLYNYNNYKLIVKDKEQDIKFLKEHGLPQKSKDITIYSGSGEYKTEMEKLDDKIHAIQSSIRLTKHYIKTIDKALSKIKNDDYYNIIQLRYMDGMRFEDIADIFNKELSTIYRNKNRLINILQIQLFTDDTLIQLMN